MDWLVRSTNSRSMVYRLLDGSVFNQNLSAAEGVFFMYPERN